MALTSDKIRSVANHGVGSSYPVAASTRIYKGGIYGLNAAGYVVSGANSAVKMAGVAETSCDNSGGANGAKRVVLVTHDHVELFPVGAFTIANSGTVAFSTDDDTITATPGTFAIGTFGAIKDGQIAVHFNEFPYYVYSPG